MKFQLQNGCESNPPPYAGGYGRRGFTLIELLVVIGIIALLAGLIVGVGPGANRAKKEKLARTQMKALVAVLEQYRAKYGFYPPGNEYVDRTGNNIPPFARPSLFYELTGTVTDDGNTFTAFDDDTDILSLDRDLRPYGIEGLINTGSNPRAVKNFFQGLSSSQVGVDPNPPPGARALRFLVIHVEGPGKGGTFNTWQYNALTPTNNPHSYDLWAELYIGDRTMTIGNW